MAMTKIRISTPYAVIVVLGLTLAVVAVALGGESDSPAGGHSAGAGAVVREVATIARRDEQIRGLRFKHVPRPLLVTPAETRRESLAQLDRDYPAARRRTDEDLLELMGLVPAGTDLRSVEGDVSGGEVAGYYDTKRKRLAVVNGPAADNRVVAEITLSHELTHALEDQRFGVRDLTPSGADDGATAYTALVEGTATTVMDEYTRRFIPPGSALISA